MKMPLVPKQIEDVPFRWSSVMVEMYVDTTTLGQLEKFIIQQCNAVKKIPPPPYNSPELFF